MRPVAPVLQIRPHGRPQGLLLPPVAALSRPRREDHVAAGAVGRHRLESRRRNCRRGDRGGERGGRRTGESGRGAQGAYLGLRRGRRWQLREEGSGGEKEEAEEEIELEAGRPGGSYS